MGEATAGVTPRELEREIEGLRTRLDRSLAELDRRRHELSDVKLQLRRHPGVLWAAGGAVALLMAGVALSMARKRRLHVPEVEAKRLQRALGRAVEHPERVAQPQAAVWEKIAVSVGTTVAVALTKRLLDRAMKPL